MPEQQAHEIDRLAYEKSTHAPLLEWYVNGGYEEPPDTPGATQAWGIDPDTGAEIHVTQRGGKKHHYLTDYRVASSYPQTMFVFADRADGDPASHEELEEFLKEHDLWTDRWNPVVVPNTPGEFRPGFQFRPPGSAPRIKRLKQQIASTFDLEEHELIGNNRGFQAYLY